MSSPGVDNRRIGEEDDGVHFTWLLSTEREDDLDLVSDGDGDDAMVQLDEEYISEMERNAAFRDFERDAEEDSDFDQMELEDRVARAEYDTGIRLVSPRRYVADDAELQDKETQQRTEPTRFRRFMHQVPCTRCCFPLDGKHHKDCDTDRIMRKTKRFCAPNYELLRTLRVVKHIRIFRKLIAGTSKASYYGIPEDRTPSNNDRVEDVELGLSVDDNERQRDSVESQASRPLRSLRNSSTMEMDEYFVNEVTGENMERTQDSRPSTEVALDLDTSESQNMFEDTHRDSTFGMMRKPSWSQRKKAVLNRLKTLGKETLSNVKPGLATAMVNFPMVLAVAGGVGAHPYFGLNAAFWGAIIATFFGGSRYTIAAPTMLLTSNLVGIVATYGTYVLPLIALIAALLIYILIFSRAIELVTFVPFMVTHGVTLGTAALVVIYQLKFALGLAGNIHATSVPYYLLETLRTATTSSNWRAILMFCASCIITYIVIRWGRGLNHAFVLVPCGIFVGWLLDYTLKNQSLEMPYVETLGTRYGHVEFHPFSIGHWQAALFNWTVIGKSMEIAFICVMETYSTANMTYEVTGKRYSKNHEMFSLATGNFISGLVGGMPTSVGVARTLLNIRSGATSRAAGFSNAIFMLLFAITTTSWLRWFPLPVISCMQIVSACRSVDPGVWSKAWNDDKRSTATSLITAFLCVCINPFIGLLLGIVISMSTFSRQLSKGHSELTVKTKVTTIAKEPVRPSVSTMAINPPPVRSSSSASPAAPKFSSLATPAGNAQSSSLRRSLMTASLDDLPATRTLSIRHAVAQLHPLLEDDELKEYKYNVVVYRISGVMTFINAQTHFDTLKAIVDHKGVSCLILNVRFLYYVDYDGKSVLRNLINYVDARLDLPTYLVGVTTNLAKKIKKDQWYKDKKHQNLIWKLESDAFKDIQKRKAKLIDVSASSNATGANTINSVGNNDMETNVAGLSSNAAASPSTQSATNSSSFTPPALGRAGSRHLEAFRSSSGMLPRKSIDNQATPIGSTTVAIPPLAIPQNTPPSTSSSLPHPSQPAFDVSIAAAEGAKLTRSNSKKSFATRYAVIGASDQDARSEKSELPMSSNSDMVSLEEIEVAIGEAAKAFGINPNQAISSTEDILRRNRMHAIEKSRLERAQSRDGFSANNLPQPGADAPSRVASLPGFPKLRFPIPTSTPSDSVTTHTPATSQPSLTHADRKPSRRSLQHHPKREGKVVIKAHSIQQLNLSSASTKNGEDSDDGEDSDENVETSEPNQPRELSDHEEHSDDSSGEDENSTSASSVSSEP